MAPAIDAAAHPGPGDSGVARGQTPELSIVVPTRHEAGNIATLVQQLSAALVGVEFDIWFVDDSDDDTVRVLTELERSQPAIVHCHYRRDSERAGGLATAVTTGLRLAQGRYVCVMDGDLQHPPETIPAMLTAARQGADLVVASRYTGSGSNRGLDGLLRRLVSRGCRLAARLLFSEARRSSDPLSGFFLCRRELIDGIEFRPVGFKILLELLVCLPELRVQDVSLNFAERHAGSSKASARQGLVFLRHLASLFFEVEGSARFWKFGLVGVSGLALFLGLLALLTDGLSVPPLYAFWPAFLPTVIWNTVLNRLWTFADIRRRFGRDDARGYLVRAVIAGVLTFALYAALVATHLSALPAGTLAALIAMLINGVSNRHAVHHRPLPWADIAVDGRVTVALELMAARLGGDRAYLLPPRQPAEPQGLPRGALQRTVELRRPSLWIEASSHRAQRRTNIDVSSVLLLPVVNGGDVLGVVIVERHSPQGFGTDALLLATQAMEALVPILTAALGVPEARRVTEAAGDGSRSGAGEASSIG